MRLLPAAVLAALAAGLTATAQPAPKRAAPKYETKQDHDRDGIGKVFSGNGGYAWLVRPRRAAEVYAAGKPLEFRGVPVIGLGSSSVLHLQDFRVERPAFSAVYDAVDGKLHKRGDLAAAAGKTSH